MQRIERNYILIGLAWVIVGMIYGAWLGASEHLNFANSHAHMNLLGFVTSVLFGMLYWAFPAMAKSRLAVWQFVIYEAGVVILIFGKFLVDRDGSGGHPFLEIGSVVTIIGAALMLWLFATKSEGKPA